MLTVVAIPSFPKFKMFSDVRCACSAFNRCIFPLMTYIWGKIQYYARLFSVICFNHSMVQ